MTLVDTRTGELVVPLDKADARRLTERIKLVTASVKEQVDKLAALIAEARDREAWAVLGYRSWTDYVAAEFADSPIRLDRDDRRELVVRLAREGMSTRAIAPVVGASKSQVADDLATVQNRTVEPPAPITGVNGKTYTRPAPQPDSDEEVIEAELVEDEPARPSKPNRRPLPDAFFDATYELTKAVERIQRLTDDDRWQKNAEQVAGKHRHDLLRASNVLADVLTRLP